MNWQLVALESAPRQPWRNGGGITRELLAWPTPADWQVRISVADVHASGPFSRFEGVERWFAVLEGDGVLLQVGGAGHRLDADSEPLRFDGGQPPGCVLVRGATRDFNLMAPPGRALLQRVRGEVEFRAAAGALIGVYGHESGTWLRCEGRDLHVPAYHLAWSLADTASRGTVRGDDALWIEVLT